MNKTVRNAVIVGGIRIPFARSSTAYAKIGNQEMLTASIKALVEKFGLRGEILGEVAAGAVIKHPRDWNLAREATLGCGLDPHTPAYDLQRACGTSLTATAQLAQRIALGEIDCAIAGGVDTASDVPIVYSDGLQQILLAKRARQILRRPPLALARAAAAPFQARDAGRRGAAHRHVHGRAHRADGEGMGHRPAGAGRDCAREPPEGLGGLERRASTTIWSFPSAA